MREKAPVRVPRLREALDVLDREILIGEREREVFEPERAQRGNLRTVQQAAQVQALHRWAAGGVLRRGMHLHGVRLLLFSG